MESGDYKPTDQSYAVFKDLAARLDQQLARLEAIAKSDLPAINTQMAGLKLEPLEDRVPPRQPPQ